MLIQGYTVCCAAAWQAYSSARQGSNRLELRIDIAPWPSVLKSKLHTQFTFWRLQDFRATFPVVTSKAAVDIKSLTNHPTSEQLYNLIHRASLWE